MNRYFSNRFCRVLAYVMCAILIALPMSVFCHAEHTGTVNLANAKQHMRGEGYFWDNREKVLTLDGFSLATSEDFGLKLPDNATVKLVGTSRIKAEKYALSSTGSINFIGSGTLILESEGTGLYSYSNNPKHRVRISEGTLKIKGGAQAVLSENAEFTVTGGKLEAVGGINCRTFSAVGGSVYADGAIHATHLLKISCADVEAFAKDGAALVSDNLFTTEYVKMLAGNNADSLEKTDSYEGESYFTSTATSKGVRDSIIFGEGTPITVDYLLLGGAVVLVAAALVLPIIIKRNKTRKMYEAIEAEKNKDK
ncbi:MAG: hypothetical protein IJO81_01525 [Clostridia bacterium]|nr:hypothetical protein [Clostridia bacterium]